MARVSQQDHVDYRIFGVAPLEIYLATKDAKFLGYGRPFADAQWEKPTPDGITHEARYWIDDMFMSPILQVQAFRATQDAKYLDRAALMMAAYLDKLQQPSGPTGPWSSWSSAWRPMSFPCGETFSASTRS